MGAYAWGTICLVVSRLSRVYSAIVVCGPTSYNHLYNSSFDAFFGLFLRISNPFFHCRIILYQNISEIWCKFCHEGWAGWDMQTLICLGRGWTWPCLNWAQFCLDGILWYQKSTRVACFFWTQKNRWSGNSAKTSPRHHRDTSDAWARHHRDTSEAWARHHWGRHHRDTTETPPRHHRDTIKTSPETPPKQAVGFSDFELHISAPSSNSPWPPYWFQIYLCVWRHCCRGPPTHLLISEYAACTHVSFQTSKWLALAFVVVVVVAVGVAVAAAAVVVVGKSKNAAEKGSNHKEEPAMIGDLLSSPEWSSCGYPLSLL